MRCIGCLLLVLGAVSSARAAPTGSAAPTAPLAPIVGGEQSPAAAVGALLDAHGEVSCTASWIGDRLVVTAAHCLADGLPATFFLGDAVDGAGERVAVRGAVAHPEFEPAPLHADVAVLVLARAIDPVRVGPPIGLATAGPAVGESLRFVGFGWTAAGIGADVGVRLQRAAVVTDVEAERFRYGVATCYGDSGGPALAEDGDVTVIVGVTSAGDAACASYGVDTRIDVHRAWIVETAQRCAAGAAVEGCDAIWAPAAEPAGCDAGGATSIGAVFFVLAVVVPAGAGRRRLATAARR